MRNLKLVFLSIFLINLYPLNAQKTYQGSGFLDDWSVGVLAGVTTPAAHSAFWGGMRPVYGLEMTKYIVPEFGLGAQLVGTHHLTASSSAFDAMGLNLMGYFNLSNLFASYKGHPRFFELEAVVGAGWGHHFYPEAEGDDYNFMTSKFGLNLNFNLSKDYAWALSVKPMMVYNLDNGESVPAYNINHARFELTMGLTYHFLNANNRKHHFTLVRLYDPTEIDALNAKVNGLKKMVEKRERELKEMEKENEQLRKAVQEE